MEKFTKAEKERFNSKWKKVGQCYLWQGPLDKDGYGSFFFRRRNRRAHRVAYYYNIGDIPQGFWVDHLCGNRNCVRSDHLRLVTPKQNALENSRSVAAINARKTHCKNGHEFDRKYGNQRYCSICHAAKSKRLRKKWKDEDQVKC